MSPLEPRRRSRATRPPKLYEKWLEGPMSDVCEENKWIYLEPEERRNHDGKTCKPDFVVYSAEDDCIIIDAKNYNKAKVAVRDVRRLMRDVRAFGAMTGIMVCAHSRVAGDAMKKLNEYGFYVVETEGLYEDDVADKVARIINRVFRASGDGNYKDDSGEDEDDGDEDEDDSAPS